MKKLRNVPDGSLQDLFYRYFTEPDYAEYKKLFLAADWFNLSKDGFNSWRNFLKKAHVEMQAYYILQSGNMELGIVKYTYVIDDQEIYETFSAKHIGSSWHPTSAKEEQKLIPLTNILKYTNAAYLQSLTETSRNHSSSNTELMTNGNLVPEKMMMNKDSVKIHHPEDYHNRYNDDFTYRTDDKFKADRLHDTAFNAYLAEMKLSPQQTEVVMKLILAQDYLLAAKVADEYSSTTYTNMPFVDKIRELYGKDRIRKWDQENNKWD
ncbi:MAG TPA: hypothetical protein VFG10_13770 [Saprospiraceae bacterium]|nr:hypothetical protein [Saprospiraceae bacterium]